MQRRQKLSCVCFLRYVFFTSLCLSYLQLPVWYDNNCEYAPLVLLLQRWDVCFLIVRLFGWNYSHKHHRHVPFIPPVRENGTRLNLPLENLHFNWDISTIMCTLNLEICKPSLLVIFCNSVFYCKSVDFN